MSRLSIIDLTQNVDNREETRVLTGHLPKLGRQEKGFAAGPEQGSAAKIIHCDDCRNIFECGSKLINWSFFLKIVTKCNCFQRLFYYNFIYNCNIVTQHAMKCSAVNFIRFVNLMRPELRGMRLWCGGRARHCFNTFRGGHFPDSAEYCLLYYIVK